MSKMNQVTKNFIFNMKYCYAEGKEIDIFDWVHISI